jgi:tRNA pseudouridine55 synthase
MPRGAPRQPDAGLDGVLVVAKPAGPSSHDIVALVRRLAATRRIGHGGTLDPFAAGVLPLFLGRATRLAEYHLGAPKAYRATICFGASSTTDDLEGELTPVGSAPTRDVLEAVLPRFTGPIRQRPPAFSAIKVGGRRAYAAARAGETPVLADRTVTITRLALVEWTADDPTRPIATVEVDCSAGTYVRALARDIGQATGSGAYLGALVRTRSGAFSLNDALTIDTIRSAAAEGGPDGIRGLLRPVDAGLDEMPSIELDDAQVRAVAEGQFIRLAAPDGEGPLRLLDSGGSLIAIGHRVDGRVAPTKVLAARAPAPRRSGAAASAQEPPAWRDEPSAQDEPMEPVEAALASELDPEESADADPASADDA